MSQDFNKLGPIEKTIIVCVIAILTFLGLWLKWSYDLDNTYLEKGFKKCSFIIPGRSDYLSSWQEDCSVRPKIIYND